jgi:hypothetical protein
MATIPGITEPSTISLQKADASAPPSKFGYFGYLIMGAAFIMPFVGIWTFISLNKISRPDEFMAVTMMGLFIFVTMSTVGLIVLASSGELNIDTAFLKWLAGATIAEVAGMCTIIVRAYFMAGGK